ncbi:polysaccharide biosynthesis tyrosine autokinase [uncultured Roseobacter sp.]|uniref:GumC family protein n=1 Tax=uncultured Roseobacter sp. TaxID=114847 RepID=UPI002630B98E|nr:polysaccharide biosynthesis tyrosine autokinase [uncultured Roseobacter sp.]
MNYTPPREPFAAGPEQDDAPVGIVALWQLLWRNKRPILISTFGLAFLTGLLVLRSDDTYTAEAQMLLARGNLEIVEFDSAGGIEVSQGALANALTILDSRSVALDVMDRLDLLNDPEVNPNLSLPEDTPEDEIYSEAAVRQYALDWLAEMTLTTVQPGSNAIVIRATTTEPGRSAAIANAYLDAYLDYRVQSGQNETERAAEALATRVNELRLQLEQDQESLQEYRGSAQNATLESADALASEAANVRARLATTEEALAEIAAARTVLDEVPEGDTAALVQAIEGDAALARIASRVLTGGNAEQATPQDIDALTVALNAEDTRLTRLRNALQDGREQIESRVAEMNAFTVGLRQLEVEVETTSQVYEASLARLKELVIQTGLRDAGAQVLARAEAPLRTDAQGRRRMVAIAAVLGLFLGIAYVLVREAANDRVRRVSDLIEITGCDTVVQLPAAQRGFLSRGKPMDFTQSKRKVAPFLEGVRALRHRLTCSATAPNETMVAGIFSSLPSEGKSTLTQALGHSFAMIDKRVIVVDGDMRAGTLSNYLGVANDQPGLQEVLANRLDPSEAIVSPGSVDFDFLASGNSSANPADLLESPRFEELINALRQHYDVVLFDTPPILVLPDAPKIAALMGAHVLVTDHDRSPRAAVRDAVAALQAVKVSRPIVAFCNAPKAFGQNYGSSNQAYGKYWA